MHCVLRSVLTSVVVAVVVVFLTNTEQILYCLLLDIQSDSKRWT